jgi:hypothetical protein
MAEGMQDQTLAADGRRAARPMPAWSRPLALLTAVLLAVSTMFPVIAGLSKDTAAFPRWFGVLDVVLAFLVVGLAISLAGIAQGRETREAAEASYRTYRVLLHGLLAGMVIFFLWGDRIAWINCLIGFVWRAWLQLYTLPAWFTALRSGPRQSAGAP